MTEKGIPFSFSFMSYNASNGTSDGIKQVTKAQLRVGYKDNQSLKASVLIGYVNAKEGNRWFYLPLLLSFNGYKVIP
ncbi:hypothetical protein [Flavobacterium nitratireducens]|uniref:hypothetical protein n=1 Tax=Flavobacterium nitratireducens TaxID=992289 RepID=UPI0024154D58|nr:hypothetical protein [Flavobacterium nitratireducens]